jgi:NAD(P)-dependent dehydrogenase (short-subunit alcohol dehydrogenase family)
MRTHLISGTTFGIGRAIAPRLARDGDRVTPVLRQAHPTQPDAVGADFTNARATRAAFADFADRSTPSSMPPASRSHSRSSPARTPTWNGSSW